MKKVLFATTALVASAGFASAQVSVSGSAEMGIVGGDTIDTQLHQDVGVTFSMSGETDNGLSFGTSVNLDEGGIGGAGTNTADDQGYAVYISGDFGKLTLGDTDGGFDAGMQEVPAGPGSIADNETGHSGWSGNSGFDGLGDGQVLSYSNSIGDLGVTVSIEQGDNGLGVADNIVGFGATYSISDVTIGLGYQSMGSDSVMGISLGGSMNGVSVGVNFSQADVGGVDMTHTAVGVAYSMDAISVGFNYGIADDGTTEVSGHGFSAAYDLGGGASVKLGANSSDDGTTTTSSWSLGVAMGF